MFFKKKKKKNSVRVGQIIARLFRGGQNIYMYIYRYTLTYIRRRVTCGRLIDILLASLTAHALRETHTHVHTNILKISPYAVR